MILATHAIVGAAAGRIFLNPLAAFAAGFISHFIIDAIPHWDYKLASVKLDENFPLDSLRADIVISQKFIRDLIFIGFDFTAGIIFAVFIFQGVAGFRDIQISLLAGALGGFLPDALQFVYFKIRREPLTTLQKIHKVYIRNIYVRFIGKSEHVRAFPYGAMSQVVVIAIAVLISKAIY